jgi:TIGR03009 family protein
MALALLLSAAPAVAQNMQWRGTPPGASARSMPDQPVVPQDPALQPAQPQGPTQQAPVQGPPQAAQPIQPPFMLTPGEQSQLDEILKAWEKSSSAVKTFECNFIRLEYNLTFGNGVKPAAKDDGRLKYAAPDRGLYVIDQTRPEKWICDGQSIYEYDYSTKLLTEHKLPPELQGSAIADSPLPFLFGASAKKLKERYFLRNITQPNIQQSEIWLQSLPRFQREKANFDEALLVLDAVSLQPKALRIYMPGRQTFYTYVFTEIKVNDPFGFLRGNPFHASTPFGWRRMVAGAPQVNVSQQTTPTGRR